MTANDDTVADERMKARWSQDKAVTNLEAELTAVKRELAEAKWKPTRPYGYGGGEEAEQHINALEAELAEAYATIKRQLVWSTAGLHGKAEDDRINADKLVAINDMVNDLEERANLLDEATAALGDARYWMEYADLVGTGSHDKKLEAEFKADTERIDALLSRLKARKVEGA